MAQSAPARLPELVRIELPEPEVVATGHRNHEDPPPADENFDPPFWDDPPSDNAGASDQPATPPPQDLRGAPTALRGTAQSEAAKFTRSRGVGEVDQGGPAAQTRPWTLAMGRHGVGSGASGGRHGGHTLFAVTMPRDAVAHVLEYCRNRGLNHVRESRGRSQHLDGLFVDRYGDKAGRRNRLTDVYRDKPFLLRVGMVFLAVFANFTVDPENYIRGIDGSGFHPWRE